jgi:hypothetical protein
MLGSAAAVVAATVGVSVGVGTIGPGRRPHVPATPTTPAPSGTPTTSPKITSASSLVGHARITYTTGFSFLSPTDGYAIFRTDQGTSPGTCGHLFVGKTTDGGGQFSSVTQLPGCHASAITFDDQEDGFVYGPDLYVTHDGGTRWVAQKEPGKVLSVRPYGSSTWLLVSECPPGAPSTTALALCHLAFYESSDGGRSWKREAFPTTALMYTQGGGANPQSVVRASTSTGYVVPAPLHENRAATDTTAGTVAMWATSDAGKSWVERTIPCGMLGPVATGDVTTPNGAPLGAVISAAPTGSLFAICSYAYPGQSNWQQYWRVLTSADGGATWSTRASEVFGGKLGKLDAVSSATAFELGFHGQLIKTVNGGSSWLPTGGVALVTSPYALEFFGATDGVALGGTVLWHTGDGGASWTQVLPTVVATSAPACTANQLQVGQGRGQEADGHILDVVLLTNTGTTCTLGGTPLLFGTTPDGKRSLGGLGAYTWFGTLDPTLLSHGEQGLLWLQTTTICGRVTHGRVDNLVADLPGRGGTLNLPGLSFTLACGISESQLGIPRSSTVPLGSAASLKVELSGLPVAAISGSLLHYTVTLYNLTTVTVSMIPCPRYSVAFQAATGTSKSARVLAHATGSFACRTVRSIPPGGTAHVSFSARAPKVKHITTTSFTWKFDVPGVVTPPTGTSTTGIARSGMKTLTATAAAQNGIK